MSICDEDASLPNRIEKARESEKRPKLYLGKVFLDKRREIHRATERRSYSTFISSWNGPASLQNRKPKAREPKWYLSKVCSEDFNIRTKLSEKLAFKSDKSKSSKFDLFLRHKLSLLQ